MDKTKSGVMAGLAVLVGIYLFTRIQDTPKPPPRPENSAAKPAAKADPALVGGVTELKIEEIKAGTGRPCAAGDTVQVRYKGTLLNGEVFDSNQAPAPPFSFPLGGGQVIKGWDQGVAGMKVGGKRKLTIPASLAYGDNGAGSIPPGATLVFEVELVSIGKGA